MRDAFQVTPNGVCYDVPIPYSPKSVIDWGGDPTKFRTVARQLEAGTVWINRHGIRFVPLQPRERTMLWERRGVIETRLHAKVLSIRPVYALFHANGPAFEYRGFWQTHAHYERRSLRLQPAILYRVQQPHKCSLGCAGNPHHSNHARYA